MKTKTPFAATPKANPICVVPNNPSATDTLNPSNPHATETRETIQARANSVTVVLQKILTRQTDYPRPHGGIND